MTDQLVTRAQVDVLEVLAHIGNAGARTSSKTSQHHGTINAATARALASRGLIEQVNGTSVYRPTEQGLRFLTARNRDTTPAPPIHLTDAYRRGRDQAIVDRVKATGDLAQQVVELSASTSWVEPKLNATRHMLNHYQQLETTEATP